MRATYFSLLVFPDGMGVKIAELEEKASIWGLIKTPEPKLTCNLFNGVAARGFWKDVHKVLKSAFLSFRGDPDGTVLNFKLQSVAGLEIELFPDFCGDGDLSFAGKCRLHSLRRVRETGGISSKPERAEDAGLLGRCVAWRFATTKRSSRWRVVTRFARSLAVMPLWSWRLGDRLRGGGGSHRASGRICTGRRATRRRQGRGFRRAFRLPEDADE